VGVAVIEGLVTVDEVEIVRHAAGVESNTAAVVGQSVAFD
jgi:hypothetical protein